MSQVVTYSRFWMRRDTALNWSIVNPVLHAGEIGIEQDPAASPGESRMKIGDGIRAWNLLDYFGEGGGGGGTITLFGDVTGSGTSSITTTLITTQSGAHTWTATQTFHDFAMIVDANDNASAILAFPSSDGYEAASGFGWRIESTADNAAAGFFKIETWTGLGWSSAFLLSPTTLAINGSTVLTTATGQPLDATLTELAANNWVANAIPIGDAADGMSQVTFAANTFPARGSTGNVVAKTISDDALLFLAAANDGAMRTELGLGTVATHADSEFVHVTGTESVGGAKTFTNAGVFASTLKVQNTFTIDRVGAGAGATINLDVDSGQTGQVVFSTGGSNRILIRKTATAESGANVGSDVEVLFRDDSGAALHTAVTGNRASGVFNFKLAPTFTAGQALALGDGGTGAELADPGADRIFFWDDSAGSTAFLDLGTNLSISGTTLNASSGGGWTVVVKSANQSTNTDTVLTNDSELVASLAANTVYHIKVLAFYETANATMDLKYAYAYSGTITAETMRRCISAAGATGGTDNESTVTGTPLNTTLTLLATTTGVGFLLAEIELHTNTAGTFSFQWAQNTSDAGNLTIRAGSYLQYKTP